MVYFAESICFHRWSDDKEVMMKFLSLILTLLMGECFGVIAVPAMRSITNQISPRAYEMCMLDAAKEGKKEIVKNLVDAGCNVNAKGENGITALMYAVDIGNEDFVKYLLEHDCDVNIQTIGDRFSALLLACLKDYGDIAEMLIDFGANVNVVNKEGDCPLIFAVNNNNMKLVRKLIFSGANIYQKNNHGLTPVSVALACHKAAKKGDKPKWNKIISSLFHLFDVRFKR